MSNPAHRQLLLPILRQMYGSVAENKVIFPLGQLVYENVKTETDLKIPDEGKKDHGHSQQIKLNNFAVSLWDKRKEILYPISTATEA